jgi:hypothetical protein
MTILYLAMHAADAPLALRALCSQSGLVTQCWSVVSDLLHRRIGTSGVRAVRAGPDAVDRTNLLLST